MFFVCFGSLGGSGGVWGGLRKSGSTGYTDSDRKPLNLKQHALNNRQRDRTQTNRQTDKPNKHWGYPSAPQGYPWAPGCLTYASHNVGFNNASFVPVRIGSGTPEHNNTQTNTRVCACVCLCVRMCAAVLGVYVCIVFVCVHPLGYGSDRVWPAPSAHTK